MIQKLLTRIYFEGRISANKLSKAHELFDNGFDLSIEFRTATAIFYSKLHGFRKNILKLLDFDPIHLMNQNSQLHNLPQKFANIAEFGTPDRKGIKSAYEQ